ncbi:MAG: hypothetical protein IJ615_07925 [Bacteroidaceae bacterium]|nr:hypothetical protein [Bacteroidaceae bacterium]
MKKTYLKPESFTVVLSTKCILQSTSMVIDSNESNSINDSNEILTKESQNTNMWDNEW